MQHCVAKPCIVTFILLLSYFIEVICLREHSMEVIYERTEVVYINEKYIRNFTLNVRRFSKVDHNYVVNMECDILQQWTNNVSISSFFYEYLHNEYRVSFVELHYKMCDLINKDNLIGAIVRSHGIECPVKKGHLNLTNWRAKFPKFQYLMPFKRFKADVTIFVTDTRETMARGYVYGHIKQN